MENNVESEVDPDGTKRLKPLEEVEPACEIVNRQLPSHGWLPIVVSMTLAVALILGAAYVYVTKADHDTEAIARRAYVNTQRIEAAATGLCRRTQLLRERSNLSDARQYLFFRTAANNPKNPPRVQARYDAFAGTTEYGAPTDCAKAVGSPLTYMPPRFVLYARLPVGYPVAVITAPKIGPGGRRQPTFKQWQAHRKWWAKQAVKTGVLP